MTSKITEIWAYIAEDKDGIEGIMGADLGGEWMPFVFAQKRLKDKIHPIAKEAAKAHGVKVTLVKFSVREDIEVLND